MAGNAARDALHHRVCAMVSVYEPECERVVADLMALMSLPEKAGQLASAPCPATDAHGAFADLRDDIAKGRIGIVEGVTDQQLADVLQTLAYDTSRLGIPLLFPADEDAVSETIMPSPLALASSWSPVNVAKAEMVVAHEAADRGTNWVTIGPLGLHRPGKAATADQIGCDPFLAGTITAARIAGLQGTSAASETGIMATLDLSGMQDPVAMLRVAHLAMEQGGVCAIDHGPTSGESRPDHAAAFAFLEGPGGFDGVLPAKWRALAQATPGDSDFDDAPRLSARTIVQAIISGQRDEADLDDAVARILRVKIRLGLLKAPHAASAGVFHHPLPTPVHNRETALAVACRSAILLRNDPPLLPLGLASGDVLIVGRAAADRHCALGERSGLAASVIDGIEQLGIPHRYVQGLALRNGAGDGDSDSGRLLDSDRMAIGMACEAAKRSGTTIYVHDGGEDGLLSEAEAALLSGLLAVKPALVVVTLGGVPIDPLVNGRHLPCLLHAGRLGTMSGHAIAHLLSGEAAPGGKLPIHLPASDGTIDLPFGHGLTYTSFALRDLSVEFEADRVRAFAQVRNTGEREGAETVQLYLRSRTTPDESVLAERRSLVAFKRVRLDPGASQTVSFRLGREEFGRYYPDGSYRVAAGSYDLTLGTSSRQGLDAALELDPSLARAMSAQAIMPARLAQPRRA